MSFRKVLTLVPTLVLITIVAASAASAYNPYKYSSGNGSGTLAVFVAEDQKASKSGFGVSYTTKDNGLSDITYLDLSSYRMLQVAKLTNKNLSGYPVHYGFTFGYSSPKSGESAYRGITSGLQAVLASSTNKKGISIDLRVCSMSHDINPIKWVSDPDILWGGAGISYSF